jgi:hypothetical protein
MWPFGALVGLVQPYVAGLHRHTERTQIYVSRGTGFWGVRVAAPAESPASVAAFTSQGGRARPQPVRSAAMKHTRLPWPPRPSRSSPRWSRPEGPPFSSGSVPGGLNRRSERSRSSCGGCRPSRPTSFADDRTHSSPRAGRGLPPRLATS